MLYIFVKKKSEVNKDVLLRVKKGGNKDLKKVVVQTFLHKIIKKIKST